MGVVGSDGRETATDGVGDEPRVCELRQGGKRDPRVPQVRGASLEGVGVRLNVRRADRFSRHLRLHAGRCISTLRPAAAPDVGE